MEFKYKKTDAEWKAQLTDEEYRVLRNAGTERPFVGKYTDHTEDGIYSCAGCDFDLFSSEDKYHSGCGWPSFMGELDSATIIQKPDYSHGMNRIELLCSNCGGHLGHIFNDGPPPAYKRYCINSVSMKFRRKEEESH